MHSHVDYCWHKTFLNRVIKILICFCLVYTPFFANAGAAEKWEYDVIPDQSQTLKIKGHKVDHLGAAVNDYEYNTKIDPKSAANRTKMGTVGINRLLKVSGWGLLGTAAIEGLLNAVDWVIDPKTQSIWRNKKVQNPDPQYGCRITRKNNSGQTVQVLFIDDECFKHECAYAAASAMMKKRNKDGSTLPTLYYEPNSYVFVRWIGDFTATAFQFEFYFIVHSSRPAAGQKAQSTATIKTEDKVIPQTEPDKEVLTPEALADYANKTHPDYANPELAPKLAPKYKPEIQTDLWKPSNPWEDANSPTVQEVKKELEKAPPEPKKEPEIKPNPETGGFALPAFCSWASPVCEFINWVKDNPDNENEEPEIPKEIDIGQLDTGTFKATAGCPAPIQVPVGLGKGGNVEISYEPICSFASKWSFVAPLIGFLSGAMIIVGVGRKGEDGEL